FDIPLLPGTPQGGAELGVLLSPVALLMPRRLHAVQGLPHFRRQAWISAKVKRTLLPLDSIGEPIVRPQPATLIRTPGGNQRSLLRENLTPCLQELEDSLAFLVNRITFFQSHAHPEKLVTKSQDHPIAACFLAGPGSLLPFIGTDQPQQAVDRTQTIV